MNDRLPGTSYDNPVWHKGFRIYASDMMFPGMEFEYVHDDYDPTPNEDSGSDPDGRSGFARSVDDAKFEIDSEMFCPDCEQPTRPADRCTCCALDSADLT